MGTRTHTTGALALGLASLVLLDGCGCTAIGCPLEGVTIEVDRTSTTTQLADGLFRVCRNTVCSENAIRIAGNELVLAEVRRDDLMLSLAGSKLESRIRLFMPTWDNSGELEDGDEYSLQLLDRTGAVVEDWHWIADYEEKYPNGRRCDDDPCRKVDLN